MRIQLQNYDLKYLDHTTDLIDQDRLERKTKKYLLNHLEDNLVLFGIFIDNLLVANCGFYIDTHFPTYSNLSGNIAHICNVFTRDEYRKKGYQREVFFKMFSYAKKLGIHCFILSSKNDQAIKMYKSFGFTEAEDIYVLRIS